MVQDRRASFVSTKNMSHFLVLYYRKQELTKKNILFLYSMMNKTK